MVLYLKAAETARNKMVINEAKCNIITFNFSCRNTAPMNLQLNGNTIKSVNTLTLLGIIITEDLRWRENTANICQKVNRRFFCLWKLKQFGLKQEELLTAWKVLLRPIAEYAAPLWHSGLSKSDSDKLERLQKRAVGLILGTTYVNFERRYKVKCKTVSYEAALRYLDIPKLSERRESLTRDFAIDTFNSERHNDFFEVKSNVRPNARFKPILHEETCRTDRFRNSAIPYMSRLLNNTKIVNSDHI